MTEIESRAKTQRAQTGFFASLRLGVKQFMAHVKVENLVKRFDRVVAVNGISLDIQDGEFIVFLGPSGCGKTTTLRAIAGLEQPESGEVYIDGERVTHLPPAMRDIAMVFQNFALYPHMTVYEILAFPLKAVRTPRVEIEQSVRKAAAMLHIDHLLDRKPGKLSGGEMQRVAIGRAMVRRPKVFLMDEPLTNLDAKLRTEMRAEIKRLQADQNATTVYVTHDQIEAMSMGDRIAVMRNGVIQQIGTPTEVYSNPANLFVAGFVGSPAMNFLPCRLAADRSALALDGNVSIALQNSMRQRLASASADKPLVLGVRPEDVMLERSATSEFLPSEVYVVEPLGFENIIDVRLAGHVVKVRTAPTFTARIGETLYMRIDQERARVFDAETTEAMG
jgi:multiple sugar transport system ATP-binding protein